MNQDELAPEMLQGNNPERNHDQIILIQPHYSRRVILAGLNCKLTLYQKFSIANGITAMNVGQATWPVTMMMLITVIYIETVSPTKKGRNRSMLV